MIRVKFRFRETIATILTDDPAHAAAAKDGMLSARQAIEGYIAQDPFFKSTFEPYTADTDEGIIRRMCNASRKAGVGPMAAVAGAIAEAGIGAMIEAGAQFGVIDNGGDIALICDRNVRIGIHAGDAPLSNRIAFVIPPQKQILGVCTSSATVGPSISLGVADAICNQIRPDDHTVLEGVDDGVCGIFAIMGDTTVRWGRLPPLVSAVVDEQLISAGDR